MTMTHRARSDALTYLGTSVRGEQHAASAFERAGLAGWNVRKAPVRAQVATGKNFPPFLDIDVPGQYAVVRDAPGHSYPHVMSIVGERYRIVQNEEHADFLDAVVHESGGEYDCAASLRRGRLVYLSIKLPEYLEINGSDRVDHYVTAVNSHDGSTAFMLSLRQVRLTCANELPGLRANARFFAKHTQSLTGKVQQAREALGILVKQVAADHALAERMAATHMSRLQFASAIDRVLPPPKNLYGTDDAAKRARRAYDSQRAGLEDALTAPANKDIADTVWGGLNAFMEWTDHLRAVPGKTEDVKEAKRAVQVLTSAPVIRSKERAVATFREMAGVH